MMNIKLGSEVLTAEKVIQIYGSTGTGKTLLAGSLLMEQIDVDLHAEVIIISAKCLSANREFVCGRLFHAMEIIKNKNSFLLIDGIDVFEEGKNNKDGASLMVFDILEKALITTTCHGIIMTSQHQIPIFNTKGNLCLQTSKRNKEWLKYFITLQTSGITEHNVFQRVYDRQYEIKSIYDFIGYSPISVSIGDFSRQ